VMVSSDAKVYGLEKGGFGDIKTGDLSPRGTCAGPTAKFTPSSGGFLPESTGGMVHVTYNGECEYLVAPEVLVVA
jgi:hypothetical protein